MSSVRQPSQADPRNSGSALGPVRSSRGFTLVELLVVVGVLVFIIAMLVPALSKAQRQARTLTCLSNLRQLHLGYTTYLHQNHEHSLLYDPTYKTFWLDVLRPSFPDVKDMLLCPEAAHPSYGWGTATSSWGPYDPAHGSVASMSFLGSNTCSYGFNGWLYATTDDSGGGNFGFHGWHADRIPVFAESKWVDGWPTASDVVSPAPAAATPADDVGMSRFNLARHGHSINASFLDGHAEQIPLEHLRQLKWSGLGRY